MPCACCAGRSCRVSTSCFVRTGSIIPEEVGMTAQPLRKEDHRNPRTAEEARALIAHVESLFMPWNVEALVAGFTEDCIVRFGAIPEFRGRDALRKFFRGATCEAEGISATKAISRADERCDEQ